MLKPFCRLFGGSNNSSVSSKTSATAGFQEVSDAYEADWIEPEIVIAESELDLADLPEAAGAGIGKGTRGDESGINVG